MDDDFVIGTLLGALISVVIGLAASQVNDEITETVDGDYCAKPHVFEATYEPVEDGQ